jgi:hypothetical protein
MRMILNPMPTLAEVMAEGIEPALKLLPPKMDSTQARIMLLTIGLQESRFIYRRQLGGPARSYYQFEQGTKASRGGVFGVYLHNASRELLGVLCQARDVAFDPAAIYAELEFDDVLAAGVARLLLWTNAKPMPDIGDDLATWDYYLTTWRPGKPHPETWAALHAKAMRQVIGDLGL